MESLGLKNDSISEEKRCHHPEEKRRIGRKKMGESDKAGAGGEKKGDDLGGYSAITAQADGVSQEDCSKVKRENQQPRAKEDCTINPIASFLRNMRKAQWQLDRLDDKDVI